MGSGLILPSDDSYPVVDSLSSALDSLIQYFVNILTCNQSSAIEYAEKCLAIGIRSKDDLLLEIIRDKVGFLRYLDLSIEEIDKLGYLDQTTSSGHFLDNLNTYEETKSSNEPQNIIDDDLDISWRLLQARLHTNEPQDDDLDDEYDVDAILEVSHWNRFGLSSNLSLSRDMRSIANDYEGVCHAYLAMSSLAMSSITLKIHTDRNIVSNMPLVLGIVDESLDSSEYFNQSESSFNDHLSRFIDFYDGTCVLHEFNREVKRLSESLLHGDELSLVYDQQHSRLLFAWNGILRYTFNNIIPNSEFLRVAVQVYPGQSVTLQSTHFQLPDNHDDNPLEDYDNIDDDYDERIHVRNHFYDENDRNFIENSFSEEVFNGVLSRIHSPDSLPVPRAFPGEDMTLLSNPHTSIKKIEGPRSAPISEESKKTSSVDSSCCICLMNPKNVVLMPCRHLCLCDMCANELTSTSNFSIHECPLCRTRVDQRLHVYI